MLSDVGLDLVTDTGMDPAESYFFYSPNSQACSLDLNPHQPENKRPEMGPKEKLFSKKLMTQMFTR